MKGILAILMAGIMVAAMIAPAMGSDAQTNASVGNAAPDVAITSINSTVDPGDTVVVSGTLTDPNGITDVNTLIYDVKYPNDTLYIDDAVATVAALWSFNFSLPSGCNAPPGNWTVEVIATDLGSLNDTDSNTFKVNDLLAINVGSMNYGSVTAGNNDHPGNHTVTNTGNIIIFFNESTTSGYDNNTDDGIKWTGMTYSGTTIPDSKITTTWTNSTQIAPCASGTVNFELDVPSGTPSGVYLGNTTFTPTKA